MRDHAAEIDEYLWPLTGETAHVDWSGLAAELQIRQRLGEILAHVRQVHVAPRLRRLTPRASRSMVAAVTEAIIAGPVDGPPWLQILKEPVPRALRNEWRALAGRLRELRSGVATRDAERSQP